MENDGKRKNKRKEDREARKEEKRQPRDGAGGSGAREGKHAAHGRCEFVNTKSSSLQVSQQSCDDIS